MWRIGILLRSIVVPVFNYILMMFCWRWWCNWGFWCSGDSVMIVKLDDPITWISGCEWRLQSYWCEFTMWSLWTCINSGVLALMARPLGIDPEAFKWAMTKGLTSVWMWPRGCWCGNKIPTGATNIGLKLVCCRFCIVFSPCLCLTAVSIQANPDLGSFLDPTGLDLRESSSIWSATI